MKIHTFLEKQIKAIERKKSKGFKNQKSKTLCFHAAVFPQSEGFPPSQSSLLIETGSVAWQTADGVTSRC